MIIDSIKQSYFLLFTLCTVSNKWNQKLTIDNCNQYHKAIKNWWDSNHSNFSKKNNNNVELQNEDCSVNWNFLFGYLFDRDLQLNKLVFYPKILFANQNCHRMFGISPNEHIRRIKLHYLSNSDKKTGGLCFGTLCKHCRFELMYQIEDWINLIGKNDNEWKFSEFRGTLFNNALLSHQLIRLLFSQTNWFRRTMIKTQVSRNCMNI